MQAITPDLIRAARALIGAKQKNLAAASGISLATLNNIERNIGESKISTFQAIEQALAGAGIQFDQDDTKKSILLHQHFRPALSHQDQLLDRIQSYFTPKGLLEIEKIHFFHIQHDHFIESDAAPASNHFAIWIHLRLGRSFLLDGLNLNFTAQDQAAMIASLLYIAMLNHKHRCYYCPQTLCNTRQMSAAMAAEMLKEIMWKPLDNPIDLLSNLGDFNALYHQVKAVSDHPLLKLLDHCGIDPDGGNLAHRPSPPPGVTPDPSKAQRSKDRLLNF